MCNRLKKTDVTILVQAAITSYALHADLSVYIPFGGGWMSNDPFGYRLIVQLQHSMSGKAFPMLIGWIGFYFLYRYLKMYRQDTYKSFLGLAFVFAFFQTISFSFLKSNSLEMLYCCGFQILKSAVIFMGYVFLFYHGILALYTGLEHGKRMDLFPQVCYGKILAVLLLIWFPHVLVQFPAGFTPDSIWQLEQGVGTVEMSAHHPPFHSWLMGACTLFGANCFGSSNIGIFLFILLQYIFMASIFAYSIYYLVQRGTEKFVIYGIWMVYAVCPLITGYLGVVMKDVPYSAFFVWMIIGCVRFMDQEKRQLDVCSVVSLSVSSTCMILTRKEGKMVVCVTLLVLAVYVIVKNRKQAGQMLLALFIIILPLLTSSIVMHALETRYQILPASRKEALSLPFQQTARTVWKHSDEIPDEEREVIDRAIGYDTLAERYNPLLSDPVKNYYYGDIEDDVLKDYALVWLKQLIRYPFTYLEATLHQNFFLLSIYADDRIYYHTTQLTFQEKLQDIVTDYAWLEEINQIFVAFYHLLHDLPLIQFLCSRSIFCMLMLVFTVFVFCSGKKGYLVVLVPLWMVFAVCIMGPAVNGHPRYVFPIVYSMPFLFGHYRSKRERILST